MFQTHIPLHKRFLAGAARFVERAGLLEINCKVVLPQCHWDTEYSSRDTYIPCSFTNCGLRIVEVLTITPHM